MADRPARARKQPERLGQTAKPVDEVDEGEASDTSADSEEQTTGAAPTNKARRKSTGAAKQTKAAKQGAATSLSDALMGIGEMTAHEDAFIARWTEAGSDAAREDVRKDILSVVMRLAGASDAFCDKLDVSMDFSNKEEMDQLARDLIDQSKQADPEKQYSTLQTEFGGKPANTRLRKRLQALVHSLVARTETEALSGQAGLAECIADVALSFSSNTYRPLRHVASLTCSSLFCALLDRASALEGARANVLADLTRETSVATNLKKRDEKKKDTDAAVLAKTLKDVDTACKRLSKQAEDLASHASALTTCAQDLINAFVANRYRDDAPGIRVDTIEALGTLMASHPGTFLTNAYLKYLGWLLNDRDAHVRGSALRALTALYSLPAEDVARTDEFMVRFRPRVAEMTCDVDDRVATDAVSLLHVALAADQLTQEEIEWVQECLVSDAQPVRAAAGAMLLDFYPTFDETSDAMLDGADGGAEEKGEDGGDEQEGKSKGKSKGKDAAGKAAAKAATASAERARKARTQLLSIVEVVIHLLPPNAVLNDKDATEAVTATVEHVVSAFWPSARGAVLANWDAHRLLLLGGGTSDRGHMGPGGDSAAADLTELQTRVAIRILYECVLRAMGQGQDGEIGVHVKGAKSAGKIGAVAAKSAVVLSTDLVHIDASATSASIALAGLLPELLSTYGGDTMHCIMLAGLVPFVRPASYGSQSGARLAASTQHHCARLVSQHASELALNALGLALLHLCGAEQPRYNEARAGVAKLVSTLTGSVTRLAGKLTGGSAIAKASKAKAKKGKGKALEEDEDMDVEAAEEEAAGTLSGLARYAAQQVRRLRVVADVIVGDADMTFPELEPGHAGKDSPLMSTLDGLLRDRRELAALFEATGTSEAERDTFESLELLCPALAAEALRLLTSIFHGSFVRLCSRATASRAGSEAERAEVERLTADAIRLRDRVMGHMHACLRVRHPVILAEYCTQAGIAPGGDEMETQQVVAATYNLAEAISMAESVYVLRLRQAGYVGLVRIGLDCSSDALQNTVLKGLAWSPTELDCALLGVYVNFTLDGAPLAVQSVGEDLPGLASAGAVDGDEGGEDEDLEGLEADVGDRLKLSSKEVVKATAVVRTYQRSALVHGLHTQRSVYTLGLLVDLAFSCASNDKIGSSVVRRLADELNEAGPVGIKFAQAYAARLVKLDKMKELVGAQLRALSDGVKYIAKMVSGMRTLRLETAADDVEGQAVLEEHCATTQAAVLQLTNVAKRQANALARPSKLEVQIVIVKALAKYVQASMEHCDSWPARSVLMAFIVPYLSIFPASATKQLFTLLHSHLSQFIESMVPSVGDRDEEMNWLAAQKWAAKILSAHTAGEQEMLLNLTNIEKVPVDNVRPWMPAASLMWLLEGCSSAQKTMSNCMTYALRCYTGIDTGHMQAHIAPALAATAPTPAASRAAPSTAPRTTAPSRVSGADEHASSGSSRARGVRSVSSRAVSQASGSAVSAVDEDEEELSLSRTRAAPGSYLSFQPSTQGSTLSEIARAKSGAGSRKSSLASKGKGGSSQKQTQAADEDEEMADEEEEEEEEEDEEFSAPRGLRRRRTAAAAPRRSLVATLARSQAQGRSVGTMDLDASQPMSQAY